MRLSETSDRPSSNPAIKSEIIIWKLFILNNLRKLSKTHLI